MVYREFWCGSGVGGGGGEEGGHPESREYPLGQVRPGRLEPILIDCHANILPNT